jgi:hypothetical protein
VNPASLLAILIFPLYMRQAFYVYARVAQMGRSEGREGRQDAAQWPRRSEIEVGSFDHNLAAPLVAPNPIPFQTLAQMDEKVS